jgi:VanZ family protein
MIKSPALDLRSATFTLFLIVFILYGSLYPFQFYWIDISPNPFTAFLATREIAPERGDVISNILAYLPLGFFAVRSYPRVSAWARVMIVASGALLFASAIEITQFYDAGRASSVYDAIANAFGAALGAVAGVLIAQLTGAMLLLTAFFGSRLLPFFPSFDFSKYATAFDTSLEPLDIFRSFALWLAAGALIEVVFGPKRLRILIGGMVLVFLARLVLMDTTLAASEIVGGLSAALLWMFVLTKLESRTKIVCAVFTTFITVDALRPFHFDPFPRRFSWIPFRSFMQGLRESGSRVFLEKTFMYGALVWFLHRSGLSRLSAAGGALVLVFVLRIAQTYLPGRSAEITDALMVLIFSGLLWLLPD